MIIIGEKINGSLPSVKQAIQERDEEVICNLAVKQCKAGADYLDVCAATAPEVEVVTQFLSELGYKARVHAEKNNVDSPS